MRVADQVVEHVFGSPERALGVHDPLDMRERREPLGEDGRIGERGVLAEEAQLAGVEALRELARNSRRNSRESTRTGRKKPGRQATQRSPSGEMPPPGTTQCTCG